eukprot:gene14523-16080_t
MNNFPDIVAYLISFRGLKINLTNKKGETALMLAAQSGCRSITGLLLQRPDVFLNKQDDVGRTALHWACFNGHDDVAEMLLGHRKINRVLCDKNGATARSLATDFSRSRLSELFPQESLPPRRFEPIEEKGKTDKEDESDVSHQFSDEDFPRLGIRLSALDRLIRDLTQSDDLSSLTTADVCERYIKPATAKRKLSLCQHLLGTASKGVVDVATVFVSHAWQCGFTDVIEALIYHLSSKVVGKEVVVWLDVFSLPQHLPASTSLSSSIWLTKTLPDIIASIGRTVLVLAPWADPSPAPLTRAWCLYELHCSIKSDVIVEIALSAESDQHLLLERHIDELRRSVGSDNPLTLDALHSLASLLIALNRADAALPHLVEYSERNKALHGLRHRDSLRAIADLARVHASLGKNDVAIHYFTEYLSIVDDSTTSNTSEYVEFEEVAGVLTDVAALLRAEKRCEEAEDRLLHLLALQKEMLGVDDVRVLDTMDAVVSLYRELMPDDTSYLNYLKEAFPSSDVIYRLALKYVSDGDDAQAEELLSDYVD